MNYRKFLDEGVKPLKCLLIINHVQFLVKDQRMVDLGLFVGLRAGGTDQLTIHSNHGNKIWL